jgi:ABC-type multidrug transport system fused ATPase/permease subunit
MNNFRFLSDYIAPLRWMFLLTVVLMSFESISYLTIIRLQQWLIDDVLRAGQYGKSLEIILLFAAAFILYLIFFTYGPYTMDKTAGSIHKSMVKQFMSCLYKMPTSKLQKERTATFVHHITQDIVTISNTVGQLIPRGIQQIVAALVLVVIVGMASPFILLFSTIISILYVYLGNVFSNRMKNAANEVQEAKSRMLVHVEEGISSTREVIAYHRLLWEEKHYRTFFQNYFDKVMKEGKVDNLQMISSEPLNWGVRLLILGYGGYLVLKGELSIGMFVIIFQYGSQLVQAFQSIYKAIIQLSSGSASIDRVRQVMDGERWNEGEIEFQHPIQNIRFEKVRFHYHENANNVLDNFNLKLPIGQKIAFVGTSGGGKSTIIQLLIRFFEPVSGEIVVNGLPIYKWKRSDWMNRIGIVFQDPYLFPDTIRNNLLLGSNDVSEEKIRQACQAAQIHEYIKSLPKQYETVIGDRGITLSGGQRQRLAIARTLIRDPEILILDEASSALDQTTERYLQDSIDQLREGKTTIIVAHRLSTVKNADMIYVMDQGKILEKGTHEELLNNNSLYKKLVYNQENEDKRFRRTVGGIYGNTSY